MGKRSRLWLVLGVTIVLFGEGILPHVALAEDLRSPLPAQVSAPPHSWKEAVAVEAEMPADRRSQATPPSGGVDLDPRIIQDSPVLQRWLRQVPDVQADIAHDPAFRSRVRVGFVELPDDRSGWRVGLEDGITGLGGLTISGDYQAAFEGDRESWGADLRYYLRPLGRRINVAPVVGYRSLEIPGEEVSGVNLGVRVLANLSRTGAADVALSQTWVAPGTGEETGLTTISLGYAVTRQLRLSTEWQRQNARREKGSQWGIFLEWMF